MGGVDNDEGRGQEKSCGLPSPILPPSLVLDMTLHLPLDAVLTWTENIMGDVDYEGQGQGKWHGLPSPILPPPSIFLVLLLLIKIRISSRRRGR